MNLKDYFLSNQDRNMIHKPLRYFQIYERHFKRFQNRPIKILEIGIDNGGSLQMWKQYFGDSVQVIGIDINPRCLELELKGIRVYIGDQADERFLNNLISEEQQFDIIIDDGGHQSYQQIASLQILYKYLSPDGIYLCEDCGTSYWPEYGGGLLRPGTFIEYCKSLVDHVNREGHVSEFTEMTDCITFYSDVVVIERTAEKNWETLQIGIQKI
jgi:SAM-dependent methyltransferase